MGELTGEIAHGPFFLRAPDFLVVHSQLSELSAAS